MEREKKYSLAEHQAILDKVQGVLDQGLLVLRERFPDVLGREQLVKLVHSDEHGTPVARLKWASDGYLAIQKFGGKAIREITIFFKPDKDHPGVGKVSDSAKFKKDGTYRGSGHIQVAFQDGPDYRQEVIDWCQEILSSSGSWTRTK